MRVLNKVQEEGVVNYSEASQQIRFMYCSLLNVVSAAWKALVNQD